MSDGEIHLGNPTLERVARLEETLHLAIRQLNAQAEDIAELKNRVRAMEMEDDYAETGK